MNKNKTPTQLMIEAASRHSERERPAKWEHGIEEFAHLVAEALMEHVPAGAEGELRAWLRTSEGARALRESLPRAVELYLSRSGGDTDITN